LIKHIILFILTAISTYLIGGLIYSTAIMLILLAHEMGHYFMSRRYGIPTTLPYFIPLPLPPFGTFGAIIKMKGIIINKKALFDVGVAGPLASFILSLPCALIGIKLSPVVAVHANSDYIKLGDPLLFKLIQWILIGELPLGHDIILHPLAYAGWVGLFVTALNLLPVGQLDGGHVIYAVFGEKSKWAFGASITALVLLAVFYNPGWLALIVLLLIFGMRHPQPFDVETPLDMGRKVLACLMLLVFVLSFTPSPFPGLSLFGDKGGIPA
jgi:membrane-associated protease RseP (regulator of RpoE activity)